MSVSDDHYLLDNNIISTLVRGDNDPAWASSDALYQNIRLKFSALKDSRVLLPVFAIAEIRFGLAIVNTGTLTQKALSEREKLGKFLERYENFEFNEHSIPCYIQIRARLWKKHAKPKGKGKSGYSDFLPEHLFDDQAGDHLGIDEKDLLIFSCAVEHNLVFATCDRRIGMKRIIEAARELESEEVLPEVRVEDWNPIKSR